MFHVMGHQFDGVEAGACTAVFRRGDVGLVFDRLGRYTKPQCPPEYPAATYVHNLGCAVHVPEPLRARGVFAARLRTDYVDSLLDRLPGAGSYSSYKTALSIRLPIDGASHPLPRFCLGKTAPAYGWVLPGETVVYSQDLSRTMCGYSFNVDDCGLSLFRKETGRAARAVRFGCKQREAVESYGSNSGGLIESLLADAPRPPLYERRGWYDALVEWACDPASLTLLGAMSGLTHENVTGAQGVCEVIYRAAKHLHAICGESDVWMCDQHARRSFALDVTYRLGIWRPDSGYHQVDEAVKALYGDW